MGINHPLWGNDCSSIGRLWIYQVNQKIIITRDLINKSEGIKATIVGKRQRLEYHGGQHNYEGFDRQSYGATMGKQRCNIYITMMHFHNIC